MRFEAAVEAVVDGDVAGLRSLLEQEPALATARSAREHRATLLHYCAANGVEQERQRTPTNVVEIAEMLIAAGADVNATAQMYGGEATTLNLVATSGHPEREGVQEALLTVLLEHGAEIRTGDVGACLWNGRGAAAQFLAARGAVLGLAEAAGVGRLAEVELLVAAGCSAKEMRDGFLLACEYGHDAVVEYLAGRGVDLKAATKDGQTGLHMAALGGQAETAAMLLRLGLSTEVKNGYGGAALGQARWSAEMSGEPERYAGVIAVLEVFSCMTSFTHCLQTSLTLLFFYRGVRDCVAECGSARAAGSICGGRESWGAQRFCALR